MVEENSENQGQQQDQNQSERQSQSQSQRQTELPKMDFSMFVLSMHHNAMVHFGDTPSPDGEERSANLVLARQTIDLIDVISEKTKGNLTGDEERLIEHVLYDLRMRYVEAVKEQS